MIRVILLLTKGKIQMSLLTHGNSNTVHRRDCQRWWLVCSSTTAFLRFFAAGHWTPRVLLRQPCTPEVLLLYSSSYMLRRSETTETGLGGMRRVPHTEMASANDMLRLDLDFSNSSNVSRVSMYRVEYPIEISYDICVGIDHKSTSTVCTYLSFVVYGA